MIMKKQYYTIVELLAVIAIMAIVIGFAIPAVDSLINGKKVEKSAKELTLAFDKARTEAVIHNAQVALLLPVREENNYIQSNFLHRAYAIAILKNGKFDVEENENFKWELLPYNSFFSVIRNWEEDDDYFESDGNLKDKNKDALNTTFNVVETGNSVGTLTSKITKEYKKIFKKSTAESNMKVRCIYFNPDGSISRDGLSFFVMQGYVDSNGKLIVSDPGKDGDRPLGAIGIKVNSLTGRVRYYEKL